MPRKTDQQILTLLDQAIKANELESTKALELDQANELKTKKREKKEDKKDKKDKKDKDKPNQTFFLKNNSQIEKDLEYFLKSFLYETDFKDKPIINFNIFNGSFYLTTHRLHRTCISFYRQTLENGASYHKDYRVELLVLDGAKDLVLEIAKIFDKFYYSIKVEVKIRDKWLDILKRAKDKWKV